MFESLKFISIVTSIVWLAPFYFLYYGDNGTQSPFGIFGWLLIIAVTFLVIVIMSIMDDLDGPFDGQWKVDISSWKKLIDEIDEIKTKIRSLPEETTKPEIMEKSEQTIRNFFEIIIDFFACLFARVNCFLSFSSLRKNSH